MEAMCDAVQIKHSPSIRWFFKLSPTSAIKSEKATPGASLIADHQKFAAARERYNKTRQSYRYWIFDNLAQRASQKCCSLGAAVDILTFHANESTFRLLGRDLKRPRAQRLS
jgi:hypothetical protein